MPEIKSLLIKFSNKEIGLEELLEKISYSDMGYAKIDSVRKKRTGYPEVIFGEGKAPIQAAEIFARLIINNDTVLCTRTGREMADEIIRLVPEAVYHSRSKIVVKKSRDIEGVGKVVIATGGTSDEPVAEEAAITLEAFGSNVERLYDVGVAGLHRLLDNQDILRTAKCVIAVAGMEGALASVVSGLVNVPVIAVPTSVGYGAHFGGIAPLLSMMCSCAAGISVVNIDNGFGAAYQADMINKMSVQK